MVHRISSSAETLNSLKYKIGLILINIAITWSLHLPTFWHRSCGFNPILGT